MRKAHRRGESVRATTGKAPGGKALEREGICNRFDISDDVDDRTAGLTSRVAVAGTVVRDEANAVLERERDVPVERLAGGRRAVVEEDRTAVRVSGDVDGERPAVRRGDGEFVQACNPRVRSRIARPSLRPPRRVRRPCNRSLSEGHFFRMRPLLMLSALALILCSIALADTRPPATDAQV
jgi:hypothetical protein